MLIKSYLCRRAFEGANPRCATSATSTERGDRLRSSAGLMTPWKKRLPVMLGKLHPGWTMSRTVWGAGVLFGDASRNMGRYHIDGHREHRGVLRGRRGLDGGSTQRGNHWGGHQTSLSVTSAFPRCPLWQPPIRLTSRSCPITQPDDDPVSCLGERGAGGGGPEELPKAHAQRRVRSRGGSSSCTRYSNWSRNACSDR